MQVKRGQVNEPRKLAVYLARKMSGLSLEDIGQEFGITTCSSVSSIVTRFKEQLLKNRQLRNKVELISRQIQMGQAKT